MECTDDFPGDFQRYLAKDIAAGKANESDVDTAAINILRVQIELGELDQNVTYRCENPLFERFYLKTITLPRQARVKLKETLRGVRYSLRSVLAAG
eukprot:COSAG06_NODE_21366_length_759_cov_1.677273_2_plen_96_part_00